VGSPARRITTKEGVYEKNTGDVLKADAGALHPRKPREDEHPREPRRVADPASRIRATPRRWKREGTPLAPCYV